MTREQEAQAAGMMRLAQTGDQLAYASLLAELTVVATRFARLKVGNAPWVEDVVQETLIAVHGARQTYDPARPFAPWFYAIASSRLIDVIRREKRHSSREITGDVLPDVAANADGVSDRVDVEAIRAAVSSLPSRQRDVIEQLKLRDRTVREVAADLRMSESAVKVTAHRGYRVLRRLLGERVRED